ncbi:hypothetical protein M5K25_006987 [Dendrobium thyrsiflorum]|uniref:Uncharacterized protein n=1 Tax=Dendrobium thyrsiflorum TaxID=117978 RepID=A0ABD0VD29_DENTH
MGWMEEGDAMQQAAKFWGTYQVVKPLASNLGWDCDIGSKRIKNTYFAPIQSPLLPPSTATLPNSVLGLLLHLGLLPVTSQACFEIQLTFVIISIVVNFWKKNYRECGEMCIQTKIILSEVNPAVAPYWLLPFLLDEIKEQGLDKHILNARLHIKARNSRNPVVFGHDLGDDG